MKYHKFMKFCPNDYMLIENYELALADNFKGWICHHINGEIKSREELIELGLYYDVPYYMLKFVTVKEHRKLHKDVLNGNFKGHQHTEEARRKIGEAGKKRKYPNRTPWNKGMRTSSKWSKETKWKLSDDTKRKHSEIMKLIWKERKEKNND
ncbi:MAG: hypothetical protein IKG84_06930 [Bacteroidales bacterium]|uniref:hypothetical protein n=1 Tax=Ralstonia pseudosolanacearum TaxID=1310165 RepID=UPI003D1788E4|nr:hypothetical protein [Bacteroidales bacterium]